jgi:hypothetical protein
MRGRTSIKQLLALLLATVLTLTVCAQVTAADSPSAGDLFGRVPDEVWKEAVRANIQNNDRNSNIHPEVRRRFGYVLGNGQMNRSFTVVQVSTGLNKNGCSASDLFGELNSMLNLQNAANGLEALVVGLISEAPLLLVCYYSPTICSYVKHARNMMNAGARIRAGHCEAVNKFIDKRSSDFYHERLKACQQAKDEGPDALEACKQEVHENPLADLPLNLAGEYKVVEDNVSKYFQSAGDDEGTAKNKAQMLSSVFGDVVFSSAEGGRRSTPPAKVRQAIHSIYFDTYKDYRDKANAILDSASGNQGSPSQSNLDDLTTMYSAVQADEVAAIYNWLGHEAARAYLYKQAELAARIKTLSMLHESRDLYRKANDNTKVQSNKDSLAVILAQIQDAMKEYGGSESVLAEKANNITRETLQMAMAGAHQATRKEYTDQQTWELNKNMLGYPTAIGR